MCPTMCLYQLWTHGYLFYSVEYNPSFSWFSFLLKLSQICPFKTPSVGPCALSGCHYPFFFFFFFGAIFKLPATLRVLGFPCGPDGKESACNAGDPGLIPTLERSPAEGNGNPGEFHGQRSLAVYSAWGRKESDMIELLTLLLFHSLSFPIWNPPLEMWALHKPLATHGTPMVCMDWTAPSEPASNYSCCLFLAYCMCTILQLCSGLCLQAFLFSNSLHFCTLPGANQFFLPYCQMNFF